MPLIRDGVLIADDIVFISDDAPVTAPSRSAVSVKRFLDLFRNWPDTELPWGLRLQPADSPADIIACLPNLRLIEIDFPVHSDGRGFSQARLLRQRYGFAGELRAVGQVLRDQIFYMHRSGFNSFRTSRAELDDVMAALGEITEVYQPAADMSVPAFRRR